MADFDLITTEGLLDAVADFDRRFLAKLRRGHGSEASSLARVPMGPEKDQELGAFTGTVCSRCGGPRRMRLVAHDERCSTLNPRNIANTKATIERLDLPHDPVPLSIGGPPPVFSATCLQCEWKLYLVVDAGPPVEVVALGPQARGLATPRTDPAVAFYLEQAYRARSRAAFTAAASMYRSALEQLLRTEGYEGRTLADRIDAATAARPHWLAQLDDELMHTLRQLGNLAVHDGDVDRHLVLDRDLVRDIEYLFLDVLTEIYELPAERRARRDRFLMARKGSVDDPADAPD